MVATLQSYEKQKRKVGDAVKTNSAAYKEETRVNGIKSEFKEAVQSWCFSAPVYNKPCLFRSS